MNTTYIFNISQKTNKILLLFLVIILVCGCKKQKNSVPINNSEEIEEIEIYIKDEYNRSNRERLVDSTWYKRLVHAWEKKDTVAIHPFLEEWHLYTLKTNYTPQTSYKSIIDTVIKTLHDYYSYNHREYAIFPNEIYYSIIDTNCISFDDERMYAKSAYLDTMYFCPNEKIMERKVIMYTDPYRRYLDAFMGWGKQESDSWDKLRFIKYYLKGGFQTYLEDPMIHIVILNNELDTVYVEYIYRESGMEAWITRKDGKWVILRTETRWIS